MYRQILLSGCRCIELDVWETPSGPVITHGPIALQKINYVPLEEVCEAIAETAFKTSDFPVILSIENHCGVEQQKVISQIFVKVFGDLLQKRALPKYPISDPNGNYPPPIVLKRKILIKGTQNKLGDKKAVAQNSQESFINRSKSRLAELTVERMKDTKVLGKDEEKDKLLDEKHADCPERKCERNMSKNEKEQCKNISKQVYFIFKF
uniref:Phosphatidylinositol-specific phospholipase C X domain-containing protein n=1 Tax=Panagrolaimus sp. PS1159 TaxID=55785 RepID=A0AC35FY66_9BILA